MNYSGKNRINLLNSDFSLSTIQHLHPWPCFQKPTYGRKWQGWMFAFRCGWKEPLGYMTVEFWLTRSEMNAKWLQFFLISHRSGVCEWPTGNLLVRNVKARSWLVPFYREDERQSLLRWTNEWRKIRFNWIFTGNSIHRGIPFRLNCKGKLMVLIDRNRVY